MITEFFLRLLADFNMFVTGLFPDWELPDWMVDFAPAVSGLIGFIADTGAWIDWTVLIAVTTSVAATFTVVLLIRLIRAIAAHIPFFGGSGGA